MTSNQRTATSDHLDQKIGSVRLMQSTCMHHLCITFASTFVKPPDSRQMPGTVFLLNRIILEIYIRVQEHNLIFGELVMTVPVIFNLKEIL